MSEQSISALTFAAQYIYHQFILQNRLISANDKFMIYTALDYFNIIVKPTVEEYLADNKSIRKGLLATLVLHQMVDHYALDGKGQLPRKEVIELTEDVRKHLLEEYPNYQLIHDVADATKHAKLSITKDSSRQISATKDISVPPGLFQAPFGQGCFSEAIQIRITKNDKSKVLLMPLVKDVLELWNQRLKQLDL